VAIVILSDQVILKQGNVCQGQVFYCFDYIYHTVQYSTRLLSVQFMLITIGNLISLAVNYMALRMTVN